METMREYETLYILRPDLTDETVVQVNDRLKGILDRQGARLLKCDVWGKRKLAFEVAKQPKGVYVQICYLSGSTVVHEFERNLRNLESVIRYQTIRVAEDVDVEKRMAEQEAENRARAAAEAKARAESEARAAAAVAAAEKESEESAAASASAENSDGDTDASAGDEEEE